MGIRNWLFGLWLVGGIVAQAAGQDQVSNVAQNSAAGLRFLATTRQDGLAGAVSLALSPDGKFLYACGYKANALNVFARNSETGLLTHVSSVVDADQLSGAVSLLVSPDGKLAAAVAFGAKSVILFSRDAETGKLSLLAVRRDEPGGKVSLKFPIDADFSPDSRFLNVIDDQAAAVLVFGTEGAKRLALVETQTGQHLAGARGIAVHPDGKSLYVASHGAGTLSVYSRDVETGRLMQDQVLKDEQDGTHALAGAMGVLLSRDGQFVYVASGRFGGDKALSVFRIGEDRRLKVEQEFVNDKSDLVNFQGGNQLTISPDGRRLYASATVSSALACFDRDPETGKLKFLTTLRDETTGVGAPLGATAVVCSPDGRFLYLSLEDAGTISVFERSTP
jgi:6-phosphogluconolactonase (cycloisomerase 2 family)